MTRKGRNRVLPMGRKLCVGYYCEKGPVGRRKRQRGVNALRREKMKKMVVTAGTKAGLI